jgi:hypothetical protein
MNPIADSPHHARVRAAFEGRWPDRIPVCEQAFASSVAGAILGYEAFTGSTDLHYLEARAWAKGRTAHEEFVEKMFADVIALHETLDLDILFLPWRMSARPSKQIDQYSFLYGDPDGDDWTLYRLDPASRTYGCVKSARPAITFEQVAVHMRQAISQAPADAAPALDPLVERALRDYGHVWPVAGNSFMSIPMQPGWLEAVALDPGLVAEWLDVTVAHNLRLIDVQAAAGIYLFNGGGDFAFNSGPAYSPRFFAEVMAPRWKRLFDACRERGVYYIFRSDGNLWPVADALFGWAGPHAYYECDYDAGMHFDALHEAFPELVLMGNVSCDLLRRGTAEQVRERARQCVSHAAPRLVLASANSILHGTPPENVRALYETAARRRPAS